MPLPVTEAKCAESGAFLAMSDYDASLTVPGAQKVDAASGSKKKMSQVEANAAALGALFELWFAECALVDKAPEELAGNAERFAGCYELEHGFRWPSLPRVSVPLLDSPSWRAAPARMLYKMFQEKWAASRLAAEFIRLSGSFPGAPELRASLFGSGFASHFVVSAQALSQMFGVHAVAAHGVA